MPTGICLKSHSKCTKSYLYNVLKVKSTKVSMTYEMVPMARQKSHREEEEREQQLHFATARRREFNSQ